jgi:hypothetical protein
MVVAARYGRRVDATEELPKVTAQLLARAATLCPRRLALEFDNTNANREANRRYRVLNELVGDARLAHATPARPEPRHFVGATDLLVEERAVYAAAARWYVALFGDEPMVTADPDTDDMATDAPRLGVRLTGPAGLALETTRGDRELRMLSLGDRTPEEVLDAPRTRFALLRRPGWTRRGVVRVVRADLLGGWSVADEVDGAAAWSELRDWLADRVATVTARADRRRPEPGRDCGPCRFVAGCSALRP